MSRKVTTRDFIIRAVNTHGDKYDYSLVEYKKAKEKVDIICKKHGLFSQTPNSHNNGQGCPLCGREIVENSIKSNYVKFCKKAKTVHKDKYSYENLKYNSHKEKVEITCYIHGSFFQEPRKHLGGQGCPKCVHDSLRFTTEEFLEKAKKVHGDKYGYSMCDYTGIYNEVDIECYKHGFFRQKPCDHINKKRGCKSCGKNNSLKEIEWLGELGIDKNFRNVNITLKDVRLCVDGLDEDNKVIYEFYGDFFHGNPDVYEKNEINPLLKKTFGDLYNKTMKKEKVILENGYKLVTIWEKDFDILKKTHNFNKKKEKK